MTPLWRLFRTRLAFRSAAITLTVVGLLGLVSLLGAMHVSEKRGRQQEYQRLEELLDTVESTVQIACFLNNPELGSEVARGLLKNRSVRRVVVRHDGVDLVDLQVGGADAKTPPLVRSVGSPFDSEQEVCRITLTPDAEEIRRSVVQASAFVSVLLSLQLAGIGIVVVTVMVRLVTRPISRVSHRLDELEAETGQKIKVPKGNEQDEIGRLVASVNSMIDHLVNAIAVERTLRIEREVEERRYRTIFENVETGIFELNADGAVIAANPAFERMFGLRANGEVAEIAVEIEVLLRQAMREPLDLERVSGSMGIDSPPRHIELPLEVNGKPRWISVLLSQIEEGRLQGVANDITDRRMAVEVAEKMATTDALTGLGNRRGLDSRLSAAVRIHENDPSYGCVLILLDLDQFKQANDTFGHAVGDKVLEHVANLLTGLVRKADYVARLGGDEFVVLLDGMVEREDVERILSRFLERVNEPVVIGEAKVHVGASLGVAVLGRDADSEEELIRLADAAMYQAKHEGRNTYRFHEDRQRKG